MPFVIAGASKII